MPIISKTYKSGLERADACTVAANSQEFLQRNVLAADRKRIINLKYVLWGE